MRFSAHLFRHCESLLSELLRSTFAADSVVSRYFRTHRELGHGDRGFVAETVYAVLRRKRSLERLCGEDISTRKLVLAWLARVEGVTLRQLGDGLHGHWVQAYYVHLFMGDAGGRVFADVAEEKVTFAATVPA